MEEEIQINRFISESYKKKSISSFIFRPFLGLILGGSAGGLACCTLFFFNINNEVIKKQFIIAISFMGVAFMMMGFYYGWQDWISNHRAIQKLKTLPLSEQRKHIEAVEKEETLRRSHKRFGN